MQTLIALTGLKKFSRAESELHIAFIDPIKMTEINKNFLGHCGPTDVITFDYGTKKETNMNFGTEDSPIIGEIFICVDQAIEVARDFGNSIPSEIITYIVHGVLHLCGFNDKHVQDRKIMRREEERILSKLKESCHFDQLFQILASRERNGNPIT